jgi:hypothetical protein
MLRRLFFQVLPIKTAMQEAVLASPQRAKTLPTAESVVGIARDQLGPPEGSGRNSRIGLCRGVSDDEASAQLLLRGLAAKFAVVAREAAEDAAHEVMAAERRIRDTERAQLELKASQLEEVKTKSHCTLIFYSFEIFRLADAA